MRLAVVGCGDVGTSVLELAGEHGHEVVAVADSTGGVVDDGGLEADDVLSRKRSRGVVGSGDPEAVLDADYDILVEATPTTLGDAEPGFSNVRHALQRDRHVVLANKGPVAERYDDVRGLEADSAGTVLFEATVGGAIPVLSTVADRDRRQHRNGAADRRLEQYGPRRIGLQGPHVVVALGDRTFVGQHDVAVPL